MFIADNARCDHNAIIIAIMQSQEAINLARHYIAGFRCSQFIEGIKKHKTIPLIQFPFKEAFRTAILQLSR